MKPLGRLVKDLRDDEWMSLKGAGTELLPDDVDR